MTRENDILKERLAIAFEEGRRKGYMDGWYDHLKLVNNLEYQEPIGASIPPVLKPV